MPSCCPRTEVTLIPVSDFSRAVQRNPVSHPLRETDPRNQNACTQLSARLISLLSSLGLSWWNKDSLVPKVSY